MTEVEKKDQFEAIYQNSYSRVFRLCKGYFNGDEAIAEDTTQDVFIKVWEHMDRFRHESSFSTWIYRIAVNTCLLYLRKSSTKKEVRNLSLPDREIEDYNAEREEQLAKMYGCIQKLNETEKITILMVLEGIGYKEIADVVGISEDSLRVKIHRIKKNLTNCVQS